MTLRSLRRDAAVAAVKNLVAGDTFAVATAAQPADAALTAGSSLRPLAQPSRRRGTLAQGRVASRGRPARVPHRAGGWDKQQGGAYSSEDSNFLLALLAVSI